jgi:hypothetical protein
MIKPWKLFLESIQPTNEDLDNVLDLFIEIEDLKHSYFQIRGADEKRYQKVHKVEGKITKMNNILIDIHCDYQYAPGTTEKIKEEVLPRIKDSGYKVVSIKTTDSLERVYKMLPVSGKDYLSLVSDPIKIVSVLIKKM